MDQVEEQENISGVGGGGGGLNLYPRASTPEMTIDISGLPSVGDKRTAIIDNSNENTPTHQHIKLDSKQIFTNLWHGIVFLKSLDIYVGLHLKINTLKNVPITVVCLADSLAEMYPRSRPCNWRHASFLWTNPEKGERREGGGRDGERGGKRGGRQRGEGG